jgi:hypothetical protein
VSKTCLWQVVVLTRHPTSYQYFLRLWVVSIVPHYVITDFFVQIIVGSVVARSPASSMAPNAFIELGLVIDLFEKGAPQSLRARDGLVCDLSLYTGLSKCLVDHL